MPPPDETTRIEPNPYEPPGAPDRRMLRLGWAEVFERIFMWVVLAPVILMAGGVAFLATCLPVGAILQIPLAGHGDPDAPGGVVVAYLIGGVAAFWAAFALIRAINRAGRNSP